MAKETLDTILSKLEKIKGARPKVSNATFWREIEAMKEKENIAFAREDKKLEMKKDVLHRCFSM